MERCLCTIITRSHLPWALALAESLAAVDPGAAFVVLITDVEALGADADVPANVEVMHLKDLRGNDLGARLMEKYADQSDTLRWSLKPVLMEHLLGRYKKVVYGDCDLHFFNDPAPIWEQLDRDHVVLSPHFRSARASVDRPNFDLLFVGGLYNAGFVGAVSEGIPALRSWGENCLTFCVKDFTIGQCDDQAYLNLLPVYFERVGILRHRGCNVANWNMVECERTELPGKGVLINGQFPIIFVHFTRSMIDGIMSGADPLLLPHLRTVRDRLLRHGYSKDIITDSEERLARKAAAAAPPTLPQRLGRAVKRITGS